MRYTKPELTNLKEFYFNQLMADTLPFWFPKSIDKEFGGYLLMRGKTGDLIDDDKAVWIQGRFSWLLSTLYSTVEQKEEWLEAAKSGVNFLLKYCFDLDGRMFFHVTRDGKPIRKRRYFFSETFAVMAFAAYAKASGDKEFALKARELYGQCIYYAQNPQLFPAKYTETRKFKGFSIPMMMVVVSQQMRDSIGDNRCDNVIAQYISEIERDFVKDDIRCVMEQVGSNGKIINHIEGRTLNPGHAIEGAWFILYEGMQKSNQHYVELGCRMLDYMWERGWDDEYGGIIYFKDVFNNPVQEYWHDMKFWWPQNEAIIATLLAYLLTGKEKYATWHQMVHKYAYNNFLDKENGEWFGYLHRNGTVANPTKGNMFKGPFHLPRQEWICWHMLNLFLDSGDAVMKKKSEFHSNSTQQ
jgi:N-acylglucosamine 2-epimerase